MEQLLFNLKKVLTENEKQKLIALNKDEVSKSALKKLFLVELYYNGTLSDEAPANLLTNFTLSLAVPSADSDEVVGKKLRARWEGINALQTGLDLLARFLPEKKEEGIKSPFVPKSV